MTESLGHEGPASSSCGGPCSQFLCVSPVEGHCPATDATSSTGRSFQLGRWALWLPHWLAHGLWELRRLGSHVINPQVLRRALLHSPAAPPGTRWSGQQPLWWQFQGFFGGKSVRYEHSGHARSAVPPTLRLLWGTGQPPRGPAGRASSSRQGPASHCKPPMSPAHPASAGPRLSQLPEAGCLGVLPHCDRR